MPVKIAEWWRYNFYIVCGCYPKKYNQEKAMQPAIKVEAVAR
jgi:hypothetical protein